MKTLTTTKKTLLKGQTVTIIGRRWFKRANGNTYHSITVYVDGVQIGREPVAYGYGDLYLQTGMRLLADAYKLPVNDGINVVAEVSDVKRKKDL